MMLNYPFILDKDAIRGGRDKEVRPIIFSGRTRVDSIRSNCTWDKNLRNKRW